MIQPIENKYTVFVLVLLILSSGIIFYPSYASLTSTQSLRALGTVVYTYSAQTLHVDGPYIKDDQGNLFYLKGTNKYGFENYPGGGFWGSTYLQYWEHWNTSEGRAAVTQVLDAMKTWGINVVRLPQAIDHWKFNLDNHRQIIKELLQMMNDRGMYMIYAAFRVTGSDAGSIGSNLPYPPYETEGTSVIANEQDFVDYWVSIASELKDYPNVMFELWNEPSSGVWDEFLTGSAFTSWKAVTQMCITAMRNVGAEQLIISQWWPGVCTNLSIDPNISHTRGLEWVPLMNLDDPLNNLVYSTHMYRYWGAFFHQPGGIETKTLAWTRIDILEAFDRFGLEDVATAYPLLIGEIGCNQEAEDLEHELIAFETCLSIFNENGYHYCTWWWMSEDEAGGIFREHLGEASGFAPNEAGNILIEALAYTP